MPKSAMRATTNSPMEATPNAVAYTAEMPSTKLDAERETRGAAVTDVARRAVAVIRSVPTAVVVRISRIGVITRVADVGHG